MQAPAAAAKTANNGSHIAPTKSAPGVLTQITIANSAHSENNKFTTNANTSTTTLALLGKQLRQ